MFFFLFWGIFCSLFVCYFVCFFSLVFVNFFVRVLLFLLFFFKYILLCWVRRKKNKYCLLGMYRECLFLVYMLDFFVPEAF
jgi:hypothetical protein